MAIFCAEPCRGALECRFGDPSDLEDYKGGRDLKALTAHVETKLVPVRLFESAPRTIFKT